MLANIFVRGRGDPVVVVLRVVCQVKEGGILAGHDYFNSFGITISGHFGECGVKDAVDEFLRDEGYPPATFTYKDSDHVPSWYSIKTRC